MFKAALCVEMIRSTLQRNLSPRESKSPKDRLCRTSYSSLLGGCDTGKSEHKGTLVPEGRAHCTTLELTVGCCSPTLKFAGGSCAQSDVLIVLTCGRHGAELWSHMLTWSSVRTGFKLA